MSRTITIDPVFEGESFPVRCLIGNREDQTAIVQDDVEEIILRVFDLDSGDMNTPIYRDVLEVDEHISDSLITAGWDGTGGYNFYDDPPNVNYKHKIEGGRRYRFQYEIRRTDDRSPIFFVIVVPVEAVW